MRSPFPGMDPYLENAWGDVHLSLCAFIRDAIQPQLPADLRARANREVLLEDHVANVVSRYVPDTTVHVGPAAKIEAEPKAERGGSTIATVEPVIVRYVGQPQSRRWVEIIDVKSGGHVVTAIEVLSPGNKRPGPLNESYRKKIDGYLAGGVNVVELDLLRGPRHKLLVQREDLPPDRAADYLYSIHRADEEGDWEIYPIRLRDRLPVVPVPLRAADGDVSLDLQAVIDRAYVSGRYDDIDYTKPADPPLSPEDAAWLQTLLANRTA